MSSTYVGDGKHQIILDREGTDLVKRIRIKGNPEIAWHIFADENAQACSIAKGFFNLQEFIKDSLPTERPEENKRLENEGVIHYARRPAAAHKKRLKDEPWPKDPYYMYRCVMSSGCAMYSPNKPCLQDNPLAWRVLGVLQKNDLIFSKPGEFDSTDWQNSLERRTE